METSKALALRGRRQRFAAPGGSHDRLVGFLARALPMANDARAAARCKDSMAGDAPARAPAAGRTGCALQEKRTQKIESARFRLSEKVSSPASASFTSHPHEHHVVKTTDTASARV
jgi:hypothetical protein